jgi:hypothetical protein
MVARAKAKPKPQRGVAKAKATARGVVVRRSNSRLFARRNAVCLLNDLAVVAGAPPVAVKTTKWKPVDKLVKLLQRRLTDAGDVAKLHAAAAKWQAHGGRFDGVLQPPPPSVPVVPAAAQGSGAAPAPDTVFEDEESMLARHKVLKAGFRLRSRAFMLTYNSRSFTEGDADRFEEQMKATAKKFSASAWAACWEETLHPTPKKQGAPPAAAVQGPRVFHGHAYFFWRGGDELCFSNTDAFLFDTVHPRVDLCYVTNPAVFKVAALHGLWYVYVKKLGTLTSASNIHPWQQYTPRKEWLVKLWEDHKLSHDSYEKLSTLFRGGHSGRMHDLDAVRRSERAASVREHVEKEAPPAAVLRAFRPFPAVDDFVALFGVAAGPLFRRPFLAILAPTGFGKSMLGADVLRRVGKLVGAKSSWS